MATERIAEELLRREAESSVHLDGDTQIVMPTEKQWIDTCLAMARLRAALREIIGLASLHMDPDADPDDTSPEDMIAHVNGLIVKMATEALQ